MKIINMQAYFTSHETPLCAQGCDLVLKWSYAIRQPEAAKFGETVPQIISTEPVELEK